MRKPILTSILAAAALGLSPAAAPGNPVTAACHAADRTALVRCTPPVDCQVVGENDCFITNYEVGLERRR